MKPIDGISPLLSKCAGLWVSLGTVSGMIKAFNTMGTTGMGKPELLAANIGEALITTATGLVIAIPAMFFFSSLEGVPENIGNFGSECGVFIRCIAVG